MATTAVVGMSIKDEENVGVFLGRPPPISPHFDSTMAERALGVGRAATHLGYGHEVCDPSRVMAMRSGGLTSFRNRWLR